MTTNSSGRNRLNRCQPGYGASCSFCCGSHNYRLPPEKIGELFEERALLGPSRPVLHPETESEEKLFPSELQCPNVGMDPSEPGVVCCLVYGDVELGKEIESFIRGTCRKFLCLAWDELTDREVLFAARLMRDWYWYSLLINDIEVLQELCAEYERPEDVPDEEMEPLRERLLEFFHEEDGK